MAKAETRIATNALIEQDLHARSVQISWSLAVFTFVQGNFPLVWSAASEIKGRKVRYSDEWLSSSSK